MSEPDAAALVARQPLPEHVFWPVNGHPDDDECTHREDGTDATYCGLPRAWHERHPDRTPCDRCSTGLALFMVRCYLGCWHGQCLGCAEQTEAEACPRCAIRYPCSEAHNPTGEPIEDDRG